MWLKKTMDVDVNVDVDVEDDDDDDDSRWPKWQTQDSEYVKGH